MHTPARAISMLSISPLAQPNATRQGHVLDIQSGDFIGLVIDDPRTRTEINAWVFVMTTKHRLLRNGVPVKQLTCLQVGSGNPSSAATAPGRPAAPSLDQVAHDNSALQASWLPPSSDGGRSIKWYNLRYRETGAAGWTTVTEINALDFLLNRLAASTEYEAQVQAVNAIGASAWSASGTATTAAGPRAPARMAAPALGSITQTGMTAGWSAPDDRGAAITHFDLRYRTGSAAWTQEDTITGLQYAITGLSPNTAYEVQVRAANSVGDGQWSPSGTATTEAVAPPGAPGVPTFSARTHNSFTAAWSAPTVTGGAAVTSYTLRYRTGGGTWTTVTGIATRSQRVTGLTVGATYEVQVAARNTGGLGDYSGSGTVVLQDVPSTPNAPTGVSRTETGGATTRRIVWSWTAPASDLTITSYDFRWRRFGTNTWTTISNLTNRTRTITGLLVGTNYQAQVRATSTAGDSAWSASGTVATSSVIVPAAPNAPTTQANSRTEIAVAWTAPTNNGGQAPTSYDLQYRTGSAAWTTRTGVSSGIVISGLVQATTYQFRVRAVNSIGPSPWSNATSQATNAPGVPGTPSLTVAAVVPAAAADLRELTATWTAPSDNGGFPITHYDLRYRQTDTVPWTQRDAETSPFTLSRLGTNVSYDFQVRAANQRGDGQWSATVAQTTHGVIAPAAPNAPTVTAVAAAAGASTRALSVSWQAVANVGGQAPTSYNVRYRVPSSAFWTTVTGVANVPPHVLTALAIGQAYDVQVSATNDGGTGPWSPSTRATTQGPVVPAQMAAPTLAAQSASVLLATWVRPAQGGATVSNYTLRYRLPDQTPAAAWTTVALTGGTGLAYNISGLTRATEYEVQVAAINSVGTGAWSPSATATTNVGVPSAPTAFNLIADDSEAGAETRGILVVWGPPADLGGATITRYDVRYKLATAAGYTIVDAGLPDPNPLSYQIDGLAVATEYDAGVRAVNSAGEGPWVDGNDTTDGPVVPGRPATPSVTGIEDSDDLLATWVAPGTGGSPITSYNVRIRQNGSSGSWAATQGLTMPTNRFTGLDAATEYEVQVRAVNMVGNSAWSESGLGTTGDVGDFRVTQGGDNVTDQAGNRMEMQETE